MKSDRVFGLICTGGPYGDCTSHYKVQLKKTPVTVRELIEEVVSDEQEWGTIYICNDCRYHLKSKAILEYRWGKTIKDQIPERTKKKEIAKITAHGGWTQMDYYVTLKK